MKRAAVVILVALVTVGVAGCPSTSTGGPHHTPPTIIIHKP